MMSADQEGKSTGKSKIIVDEDWKTQAQAEKEALQAEMERQQSAKDASGATAAGEQNQEMPPASMVTLVSSLATQAAIALQGMPQENGPALPPDLQLARHLIDLLGVLQEKTAGNLDDEESQMLGEVHRQLQMLYVETVTYVSKHTQAPNESTPSETS